MGPDQRTMVNWLREQLKPTLQLVSSAGDVYAHPETQVLVYLGDPQQRAQHQKAVQQLADVLDGHHEIRVAEVRGCLPSPSMGVSIPLFSSVFCFFL